MIRAVRRSEPHVDAAPVARRPAVIDANTERRELRRPGRREAVAGCAIAESRPLERRTKMLRPRRNVEITDDDQRLRVSSRERRDACELGVTQSRAPRAEGPVQ